MWRGVLSCVAVLSLSVGVAIAQTAPAKRPPHPAAANKRAAAAVNRVPEDATTGKPGTANSPDPAPNVTPLQTPSKPVSGLPK